MPDLDDYPFEVRPLPEEDGGGFLISYPDFSECISDGDTIEEAIAHGRDALAGTIAALQAKGLPVPVPGGARMLSGKLVAQVPETVRAQLSTRAEKEGVSLDTLVLGFILEGLKRPEHRA